MPGSAIDNGMYHCVSIYSHYEIKREIMTYLELMEKISAMPEKQQKCLVAIEIFISKENELCCRFLLDLC